MGVIYFKIYLVCKIEDSWENNLFNIMVIFICNFLLLLGGLCVI